MEPSNMEPKAVQILTWLKEGQTREQITAHFSYKSWKSVDMYFRRRGFKWNGHTYYIPNAGETIKKQDTTPLQQKAKQILLQLERKHVNIEEVATKNGFSTTEELGDYMRNEGYAWNSSEQIYLHNKETAQQFAPISKTATSSQTIDEDLFVYLSKHKMLLIEMIEAQANRQPTIVGLPSPIQLSLEAYSEKFGVSEHQVIEWALEAYFNHKAITF